MLLRQAAAFFLIAATPALAQFSQFATTDDGSQLYFTTPLPLKAAGAGVRFPETRLYRFGADGVTLFADRGSLAAGDQVTPGVVHPSVSGDGSVVAFTLTGVCLPGSKCDNSVDEAFVRGRQSLDLGPGTVQLSRNGRWVVLTNLVTVPCDPALLTGPPVQCLKSVSKLIDLAGGPQPAVPSEFIHSPASDGTVVISGPAPQGISLWKQGAITPIPSPPGQILSPILLSDDARTLIAYVYRSATERPFQVAAINLTWGTVTPIFQTRDTFHIPVVFAASNNGQRALYVDFDLETNTGAGPAYVWDAATGASIPVPLEEGEFASDGTLSGDGKIAFLATNRRRIVKWTVQSPATATSLFPAPPYCDDPGTLAGGSLARLRCSLTAPLSQLQGHVLFGGQPMPVLYSNSASIGVQIPWEWERVAQPTLSFDLPDTSPFQSRQLVTVANASPQFLPADPGVSSLFGIQIVKGDWSGFVTRQPRPGDLVYIYMTGLGAVANPVATGEPASVTVPNPIQSFLACRFQRDQDYVLPLFAGLAPGAVGVYQTAFIVPPGSGPVPITEISCQTASGEVAVPATRVR